MNGAHFKYVLIGGGLASSSAARAIRERDSEGALLVVGQEVNRPYNRPPLSKDYLRGKRPRKELFTLSEDWFARNHVELQTGRRVSLLDTTRRSVMLDNGHEVSFDRLLIATGGAPRHLKIPGAELPNIYYLRTIEDADRIHIAVEKALREGRTHPRGRGKAAILGGGVLGVELAATMTQMGLAVDLLMASAYPWSKFAGEAAGKFVHRYLEEHGVRLHPQTVPVRLEGDGRVQRVVIADKQTLECDFVVPAVGMIPNKDLLRGTTIAAEKHILVDDHCRTSDPDIYAAGDCAAIYDALFGKYRVLDHWDSAIATGTLAGANMAGGDQRYDQASHFFSDTFDLSLSVWGDARRIDHRIVRGNPGIESPDFVEFGVASDGRIAQILAVNHPGEDQLLRELVHRRLNVEGKESVLRDPTIGLSTLLS